MVFQTLFTKCRDQRHRYFATPPWLVHPVTKITAMANGGRGVRRHRLTVTLIDLQYFHTYLLYPFRRTSSLMSIAAYVRIRWLLWREIWLVEVLLWSCHQSFLRAGISRHHLTKSMSFGEFLYAPRAAGSCTPHWTKATSSGCSYVVATRSESV